MSLQNLLKVNMVAITAGRTSFADFENDVKILFSKWPIEWNYWWTSSCWGFDLISASEHHVKRWIVPLIPVPMQSLGGLQYSTILIICYADASHNSLAHKSENVYSLSDILIRDHDVRTYLTGPHRRGKILHFAGSFHRRILKLWGGNLLSRDP